MVFDFPTDSENKKSLPARCGQMGWSGRLLDGGSRELASADGSELDRRAGGFGRCRWAECDANRAAAELHDIISCGASGLQRTALVAPINHHIRLCSFSLLGECSDRVSITSTSLRHSGSAIQNDHFQKLPNRARQAARSMSMRGMSRALLGATAAVHHGRP